MLMACRGATARELHSNGRGGGNWSEPATWHQAIVPEPDDDIVIAAGDTVVFDRGLTDRVAGRALTIDPRGTLEFAGRDAQRLMLDGPLTVYGTVRIDAARARAGPIELRVTGADPEQRRILLLQRAGLLVYGRAGLGDTVRNAVLAAGPPDRPLTDGPPLRIVAGTAARAVVGEAIMLDLHHVQLEGVWLEASRIDNTGAFADQRLNLLNNRWTGGSRAILRDCDTPFIHHNRFAGQPDGEPAAEPALRLVACRLADVRGNHVAGAWPVGIAIEGDTDSALTDTMVSGCVTGVLWQGRNAMIKNVVIEQAATGIHLDRVSGAVENALIRAARQYAVAVSGGETQLTDLRIADAPADAVALRIDAAAVTLLNANIAPAGIRIVKPPAQKLIPVQRMEYLVVRVRGRVPPRTMLEVRTAEVSGRPPQGHADLNVRNSPARLIDGLTPRPFSLRPLILRSWRIDRDGNRQDAPFYDLRVLVPATEPDAPPRVVHEQVIEPVDAWFRTDPNQSNPTIEVRIR